MDDSYTATDDYTNTPRHAVAIIGGACSGAEAAEVLSQAGVLTVVIDQNPRPFGKIEDGLPRWHARQRTREYDKIGGKLKSDGVMFVPNTKVGQDVQFPELRDMGFSAVILACGAWRDRPLEVPDAEAAVGNGLVYQNPFIYWFNHHEEASYEGERFDVTDGAVVVGGGLASIDVVKAIMLETVAAKLRERGEEVDVVAMEHKGIDKTLAALELTLEDLGLKGCTLIYRRTAREMPLASFKPGADDAGKQKTMDIREKLMGNVLRKFMANFSPNTLPKALIKDEAGNVTGLKVVGSRTEGRRVVEIEGSERVIPASQVFSSIGSIPELISGLPTDGAFYAYDDWDMGVVKDLPGVFGVGNVVTGQGNIVISRKHAKKVTDEVVARYLGVGDGILDQPDGVVTAAESAATETAERVKAHVEGRPKLEPEALKALVERMRARQQAVGYEGDFDAWIAKVTPDDRV